MPGVTLGALRGDLAEPKDDGWMEVGKVEKLYIYPVKSMAAVSVGQFITKGSGAVGEGGLLVDRQFMVVDKKGKMVTSRRYPSLSLVKPVVGQQEIVLHFPGLESCTVDIPRVDEQAVGEEGEVWGEKCNGIPLAEKAGKWLSSLLLGDQNGGLKLLFHNLDKSSRPDKTCNKYLTPLEKPGDKPLFADGYPYLMVTAPSVNGLNKVMEDEKGAECIKVEETRFRPNIFISGDFEPFSEDTWSHVRIGDSVIFRNVKLCTRCVYTTVDPVTGQKDKSGEPLKTLRKFRSTEDPDERKEYGTSPFFGVNLAVDMEGEVGVGDVVWVGKRNVN